MKNETLKIIEELILESWSCDPVYYAKGISECDDNTKDMAERDTKILELITMEQDENENQSTREAVLNEAIQCVCGHRVTDYGKPEDSFGQIAAFWNAYLGMDKGITALDVCNMMALLKMARIMTGTATEDSFVDLAGYAACGAEIAEAMKK